VGVRSCSVTRAKAAAFLLVSVLNQVCNLQTLETKDVSKTIENLKQGEPECL
jgi:hypothetical protein